MKARVDVELGSRSYPISIGPGVLDTAGMAIADRLPGARVAIITDENVAAHQLPRLIASLDAAGIAHQALVLPAGEATKRFDRLEEVVDFILAGRFEQSLRLLDLHDRVRFTGVI